MKPKRKRVTNADVLSALRGMGRVLRGLTDAQRINTDKLNTLFALLSSPTTPAKPAENTHAKSFDILSKPWTPPVESKCIHPKLSQVGDGPWKCHVCGEQL